MRPLEELLGWRPTVDDCLTWLRREGYAWSGGDWPDGQGLSVYGERDECVWTGRAPSLLEALSAAVRAVSDTKDGQP